MVYFSAKHLNNKTNFSFSNSYVHNCVSEHTILRSWAVKDFAPNVPQYVQIFRWVKNCCLVYGCPPMSRRVMHSRGDNVDCQHLECRHFFEMFYNIRNWSLCIWKLINWMDENENRHENRDIVCEFYTRFKSINTNIY